MSTELIETASALAETLERENAALAALDLPRAAGMLADKQRAMNALATARAVAASAPPRALIEPLVYRLRELAEENRLLLERSIAVQTRVIGIIAHAATHAVAAPCYGARGGLTSACRPTAFAFAARA
jgi:hypothetical protein